MLSTAISLLHPHAEYSYKSTTPHAEYSYKSTTPPMLSTAVSLLRLRTFNDFLWRDLNLLLKKNID